MAWQRYQSEKVTPDLIKSWFLGNPNANIAVVTGKLSAIAVLDFDPRHSDPTNPGPELRYSGDVVHTGGGGIHWYCRCDASVPGNYTSLFPGLDIRGEGGYVVAPPSKTSGVYKFQSEVVPSIADLPTLGSTGITDYLYRATKRSTYKSDNVKHTNSAGSFSRLTFIPAKSGVRNVIAARMAGSICASTATYERGFEVLKLWNRSHCTPPLDQSELLNVWNSIYTKHNGKVKGDIGTHQGQDSAPRPAT